MFCKPDKFEVDPDKSLIYMNNLNFIASGNLHIIMKRARVDKSVCSDIVEIC